MVTDGKIFCDECGEVCNNNCKTVTKLKTDCASANKGESATFCIDCFKTYKVMTSEIDE
jgi:hypothetical protein